MSISKLIIIIGVALVFAGNSMAQDNPAQPKDSQNEESKEKKKYWKDKREPWQLDIGLEFSTSYNFRGLNVFARETQRDANMLLAPSVDWEIFDTGLSIGYWGGFQISGDNISDNVDSGIGAEQDILLGYGYDFKGRAEGLSASAGLAYYFYPAADEDIAGTSVPSYLEPSLGVSFSSILDIGISVSYFLGLQDAVRDFSNLYISPFIAKSFTIHRQVGLDLAFSYGAKIWKDSDLVDNTHDINIGIALPLKIAPYIFLTPNINLAWTNLEAEEFVPNQTTMGLPQTYTIEKEQAFVYGGVKVELML